MKKASLKEVAGLIKQGKVGVIPTDTVYGLCAKASDVQAVKKMYDLKARENKPGTLIAADIDQLVVLGIKRRYLTPVENYWPSAISIVIPTGFTLDHLHLGKMSLAIRIPGSHKLQNLLKQTGPLITTSANMPGEPPAKTIDQAQKYFGDKVDFYGDGGTLNGQSSTIIQVIDDAVTVIREGTVKIDEETGRILN